MSGPNTSLIAGRRTLSDRKTEGSIAKRPPTGVFAVSVCMKRGRYASMNMPPFSQVIELMA